MRLSAGVATVNDDIGTGCVGAGIGDEVDVSALELLGVTVAVHGDHAPPQVLGRLVDEVRETGVNVARGDAVDTGKVAPLVGERAGHVDAASLGHVVGGLLLGVVGDVAGHGGGDDERAVALLLEVRADGLGAVGSAVEVDLDNVVPLLGGTVNDALIGGGTGAMHTLVAVSTFSSHESRILLGNESVNLAKVGDDLVDEALDVLVLADVALVGLGLDTVILDQLLDVLVGALAAGRVGDGDVGAHLGAAASGLNAHAAGTGGTGDDNDTTLQAEEVGQAAGLRGVLRHGGRLWVGW